MFGLTTIKQANRLAKQLTDIQSAKLKKEVRNLLWEITHQREKVGGTLGVLLPVIYPQYSEEYRREIKKQILKAIGY